jgi:hypothetical protein
VPDRPARQTVIGESEQGVVCRRDLLGGLCMRTGEPHECPLRNPRAGVGRWVGRAGVAGAHPAGLRAHTAVIIQHCVQESGSSSNPEAAARVRRQRGAARCRPHDHAPRRRTAGSTAPPRSRPRMFCTSVFAWGGPRPSLLTMFGSVRPMSQSTPLVCPHSIRAFQVVSQRRPVLPADTPGALIP